MSSCHNDIIFHQHVTNLTFIIILTIILLYALIKIYKPIYITLSTLTYRYNINFFRDKKRQIFCVKIMILRVQYLYQDLKQLASWRHMSLR